jgi:hypothetical protein
MSRVVSWTNAAALVLLSVSSVSAQQWSAEVQTGRIRSSLDPAADAAHSIAAGLRFEDANTQLRVMGGVPTSSEQPYWGALSGARRLALRSGILVAGVDIGAHGFLAHDRNRQHELPGLLGSSERAPDLSGHAYAAHAMPLVLLELEHLQLQVRAGLARYESEFGQQQWSRSARVADLQATITPAPGFALAPLVKHARIGDSAYTYTGVTAMSGGGRAAVWGSVGRWLDADDDAMSWAGGATLRLNARFELNASVRRDVLDPLYLTQPQTGWNIGMLFHVSRVRTPSAPVPARYANGRATIRLAASNAKAAPRIAGDFTNWQPQPMTRTTGAWTFDVALKPGVYNFAFVDAEGEWFVPENYPGRKDDGMGGHVAVLVVQQ